MNVEVIPQENCFFMKNLIGNDYHHQPGCTLFR